MKKSSDPRHLKRKKIIKLLYQQSFYPKKKPGKIIKPIFENQKIIDQLISRCAPEWPLNKINKIDLSILRLATFELIIAKKNPPKVIIDEAIELGKEYGATSSAKFINGALGAILKLKKKRV